MTFDMLTEEDLRVFPQYKKYDNGKSAILIHIPKTGGTSLRKSLSFPGIGKSKGRYKKHYDYYGLTQMVEAQVMEEALVIAFVRNPWDRLLSAYHFHKRKFIEQHPDKIAAGQGKRFSTFELWVRNIEHRGRFESQNLRPQLSWIQNTEGQIKAEFIGRFENMDADYLRICEQLKIPPKPLLHKNKSVQRPSDYREAYNPYLRSIVEEYYQADISLFGYQF